MPPVDCSTVAGPLCYSAGPGLKRECQALIDQRKKPNSQTDLDLLFCDSVSHSLGQWKTAGCWVFYGFWKKKQPENETRGWDVCVHSCVLTVELTAWHDQSRVLIWPNIYRQRQSPVQIEDDEIGHNKVESIKKQRDVL